MSGTSGGLRNVRTVRSHRPPQKEKAPLKKNHRVNCVERVYDVIIAVPYRLICLRCTEPAIHYIVRYCNVLTCFILDRVKRQGTCFNMVAAEKMI